MQGLDYGTYHAKEVVDQAAMLYRLGIKHLQHSRFFFGSYDESVSVSGQVNPGEESIPNIKGVSTINWGQWYFRLLTGWTESNDRRLYMV